MMDETANARKTNDCRNPIRIRKVFGMLSMLCLLTLSGACKIRGLSGTQASQDVSARKKTACLSFQGNGVYYSAHVGALIALLENNYEPVFATGGSSGAIIASLARALVENPSLRGSDGAFAPQKAALVLASSSPVIESFLFLPRFTVPLQMLDAMDAFFSSSAAGFINGTMKEAIVHAESVVGQSTLVIDFFRTVDFGTIFGKTSLSQREQKIASLWSLFAGAIRVKPDDLADALFIPRKLLISQQRKHIVDIQDRLFGLYRSKQEDILSDHKDAQKIWNDTIEGFFESFGLVSTETRRSIVKNFLDAARTIESFDSLPATLSGDFLLPDPKRVYAAFNGVDSRNGRVIEIPSNVILHTTARRAAKNGREWKEQTGAESLYQIFMSNGKDAFRNSQILLNPENNPLQPRDKQYPPILPTERLAATAMRLGPALAATTGEVSAFERMPMTVDSATRKRFSWYSDKEQLIGYGGWLEKVALGTAVKFDQCASKNVDLYFYTSDGVAVNSFLRMVFTGLYFDRPLRGFIEKQIRNPSADLGALLSGKGEANKELSLSAENKRMIETAMISVEALFADAGELKARNGVLPVNFLFAEPAKMSGQTSQEINFEYRSNRRAMILAVYEFTRKLARDRKLGTAVLPLWNKPLDTILEKKNPKDVLSVVLEVMPRPSLSD